MYRNCRGGFLQATTFILNNDTPALNALKALRGAPISMGRGEIPVGGCQPPSVLATIYSVIITTYNFYYFGRYPHDR